MLFTSNNLHLFWNASENVIVYLLTMITCPYSPRATTVSTYITLDAVLCCRFFLFLTTTMAVDFFLKFPDVDDSEATTCFTTTVFFAAPYLLFPSSATVQM